MRADPTELKMRARSAIADKTNKTLMTSLAMFVLWYATSWLVSNLSGYSEWFGDYYDMAYEYAVNGAALARVPWPSVRMLSLFLCALIFVMRFALQAGYVSWCMMAVRGQAPVLKDIFNGFYSFSRVIALTLLRGVLIYVGLALFVVPGLIVLYRYRLSYFVLLDHPELSAVECMRESARLTRGRRMEMLMLDVSFFVWWFVGTLIANFTIPVMEIWLRPFYGLTYASYYDFVLAEDRTSQL